MSNEKVCLWKFHWDCGRMGELSSIFKATKGEVENAIGKEVNFGEALGKHSEVYGTIEEGEIELISEDENVVNVVPEVGYNPIEYIDSDDGEEEEEEEE